MHQIAWFCGAREFSASKVVVMLEDLAHPFDHCCRVSVHRNCKQRPKNEGRYISTKEINSQEATT